MFYYGVILLFSIVSYFFPYGCNSCYTILLTLLVTPPGNFDNAQTTSSSESFGTIDRISFDDVQLDMGSFFE
ncbi:MAG: hypothetical protein ACKO2V_06615, partial [Snowella sp.]